MNGAAERTASWVELVPNPSGMRDARSARKMRSI